MESDHCEEFDAIIIGVGQAGKPLAIYLAEAGQKVAIIERNHLGGSCVNYGCTPTKMLLASAQTAHEARRSEEYGIKIGKVSVDFAAVMKRKDDAILSAREGIEQRLDEIKNLTLIWGEAAFTGPKELKITPTDKGGKERRLSAKNIIIDTGTRPRTPDIEGLDTVDWLDSTAALDLKELPEHMVIIGGGYIGVEFSQIFRRLGSQVTLIEEDDTLLAKEDKDVSEEMAKILEKDEVKIILGAKVDKVGSTKGKPIEVSLTIDGKPQTVRGSHLLVAVGVAPNVEALNLDKTKIKTDKRDQIEVDDYLETAQPGVFAVGDVKGGPQFTHISYDDYRIVKERLLEGKKRSYQDRMVPYAVFTEPQLGRVGLSVGQAQEKKIKVKVAKLPMSKVSRANETGHPEGFMKVVIDADTDQILGAAIIGMQGGELMGMIQIAMMGKLPYQTLRDGVFAHPTLTESLNNLFAEVV